MSRYRLTPAAQRDLSSIWDWTEEHWGLRQAEAYVEEIRASVERIADDPRRGRACDEIREGYRRYSIGSHLLFSVEGPAGVEIIRVLHQRMDPTRHF
ncbi:MAG: type II toxin-antitoxin system RelE/ParE family toxin [Pseudoclavibacter sp.]|nr:type II toxin-antitoxin system RelE/ParE family toxin [Pseudoclavibacter sp.]